MISSFAYPFVVMINFVLALLISRCLRFRYRGGLSLRYRGVPMAHMCLIPILVSVGLGLKTNNIYDIIEGIVVYGFIGSVYSSIVFVYFMFKISTQLTVYCKRNQFPRSAIPKEHMRKFISLHEINSIPIKASDHVSDLYMNAAFWPFAMLSFVLIKPIEFVNWASRNCIQRISDEAFGDVKIVNTNGASSRV